MPAVAIPTAFDVAGPLAYAVVVTTGRVTIVLRNASGKAVLTSPSDLIFCTTG
jgi:PHD/YefM family antitoxin component YafN of YafNO toxin-antitoxin module